MKYLSHHLFIVFSLFTKIDPTISFSSTGGGKVSRRIAIKSESSIHSSSRRTVASSCLFFAIDDNDEFPDQEALLEYLDGENLSAGMTFEQFQENQRLIRYLKACRIFQSCSEEDLHRIADSMEKKTIQKNERLITQGESGSTMFFLKSGNLQAIEETSQEILITYSQEGSVFGELALLFEQPRRASVVATEVSTVYVLDKDAFMVSMKDSPVFQTAKRIILKKYESKRLRDILKKIQIDEVLGLLKARLVRVKRKSWRSTVRVYSMGAAAAMTTGRMQTQTLKPLVFLAFGLLAHFLR